MTAKTNTIAVYKTLPIDKGYGVTRNDILLKTPASADIIVPTPLLAETIAEEWRAQKDKIQPSSMPITQFALTTIDITRKGRDAIIEQVAGYAAADLLYFHAEGPDELVMRQKKTWQPVLDWCAGRFDALLKTGQGIMPITQSPEALQAIRRAVEAYDDFRLTGLKQAAEVSGSLILGLALLEKHLAVEQAFNAAELDTHFQIEKWGDDPVTVERHKSIRDDLKVCDKWFGLLD